MIPEKCLSLRVDGPFEERFAQDAFECPRHLRRAKVVQDDRHDDVTTLADVSRGETSCWRGSPETRRARCIDTRRCSPGSSPPVRCPTGSRGGAWWWRRGSLVDAGAGRHTPTPGRSSCSR